MRFAWLAVLGLCSLAFGQVVEVKRLSVGYPDTKDLRRLAELTLRGDSEARKAAAEAWIKHGTEWEDQIHRMAPFDPGKKDATMENGLLWVPSAIYDIVRDAASGIQALAMKDDDVLRSLLKTQGNLNFEFELYRVLGCGTVGDNLSDKLREMYWTLAKAAPRRLEKFLQDPDPAVVDAAIEGLIDFGKDDKRYIPMVSDAMAKRLEDANEDVRAVAARALFNYAPDGAYREELRALAAKTDEKMLAVASRGLSIDLIKELYGDGSWNRLPASARLHLVVNQMDLSDKVKLDLKRVALNDPNVDVAAAASCFVDKEEPLAYNPRWIQSKLAGEAATERYLYRLAKRDPQTWLGMLKRDKRLLYSDALESLADGNLRPEEISALAMEIIPLFEASGKPMQISSDFAEKEVFRPVIERMVQSKSGQMRRDVMRALEFSEDPWNYLMRFLKDPDPEVRSELLGCYKGEVAQAALLVIPFELKNKDRDRVFRAMQIIGERGMEICLGDLKGMAASKDKQFAEYAQALLGR